MSTKQVDPVGYKQFTPPGWAGHGRGKDLSDQFARIAAGFDVGNPEVFQKTLAAFLGCSLELYNYDPPSAMEQTGYVLFHICKQEVPNIYENIIALGKSLLKNKRLTPDQRVAQIYDRLTNLLKDATQTKAFFEKIKRTVPRCSWNDDTLKELIYSLICKEEEDESRRKYPTEY